MKPAGMQRKRAFGYCRRKKNDIGSTAESYSAAYLGRTLIDEGISEPVFDVDALTVNPFLGIDGIKPLYPTAKVW